MPNYDRRHLAATWDRSVLPISSADLEEMDEEERKMRMVDELNRAADLLQALASAFAKDLGSNYGDVTQAAKELVQIARKSQ